MDLVVSREYLINAIQTVQNAVSQKSSLPILSNVLLDTQETLLSLTATDLDIGIHVSIPTISFTQEGAITIPARKFFDIIRSLPEGCEVSLSIKKNSSLTIKAGKATFKVIGLPKEEFPQLPAFQEKESIKIEQKTLKEMLELTDFAVSKDESRFVLNGIFMQIKGDTIVMVATDGRRLAAINKKLPQNTIIEKEVIVPIKTIQEIKRMLLGEEMISLNFSENQIKFSLGNSFVISRLIEGEYPNYKNVIPKKLPKELRVGREDFLSAARRASIFTDQDSMAIKLSIKKKKMTISKNTPYLGEVREEIDVDFDGAEEIEIGFNPKYLIDVLKSLSDEQIVIELDDATKPGVIRKGEEYTYVVLPMHLMA